MIRFSGKIDADIQLKVITKRSRQCSFLWSLFLILCAIVLAVLMFFNDGSNKKELLQAIIFGIIGCLLIVINLLPMRKKNLTFEWDYVISISEFEIDSLSKNPIGLSQKKPLSKIKKVVDYGRYYYLYLYKWDMSFGIVCQKDLISEGSLEEFENLFRDKIKRKIK